MLEFLKDRLLLFGLVIAGDWISLAALIKASEIRQDAITIAIAVSLLPSLVISILVKYFFNTKFGKRRLLKIAAIFTLLFWVLFLYFFQNFTATNNQYGKVPFPAHIATKHSADSIIVGGCNYTFEAQAEVNAYAAKKRTLTPDELFADFNYDLSQIWAEKDRDCARGKILNSFAIMLGFLIAGITLSCELLIAYKKK